ncbi:hypothetical protein Hypma_002797 [Hypsizygus marmoreus]|uniref:Uncharacterized protein n=1 Tax=Hypsizygus marmoreus TaxID=39966 RepID=A0A369J3P4_HYPMA|nr:hypothetical protein Hypma_002797 [Hypsizygus marmoreus]
MNRPLVSRRTCARYCLVIQQPLCVRVGVGILGNAVTQPASKSTSDTLLNRAYMSNCLETKSSLNLFLFTGKFLFLNVWRTLSEPNTVE